MNTKSSHDILNNNDQHTNNIITTIPSTTEISISSSNSYSTTHSPMSEPHNRKICEDITYSKARNNSITPIKYSILNDIQNNNIKNFANRIHTSPSILNKNYEKNVGNNIISQSQTPVISNTHIIHADNNINKSQLSKTDNHQNILLIKNPETSSLHSILNSNCASSTVHLKNKLNNHIITKCKSNKYLNMANILRCY